MGCIYLELTRSCLGFSVLLNLHLDGVGAQTCNPLAAQRHVYLLHCHRRQTSRRGLTVCDLACRWDALSPALPWGPRGAGGEQPAPQEEARLPHRPLRWLPASVLQILQSQGMVGILLHYLHLSLAIVLLQLTWEQEINFIHMTGLIYIQAHILILYCTVRLQCCSFVENLLNYLSICVLIYR